MRAGGNGVLKGKGLDRSLGKEDKDESQIQDIGSLSHFTEREP